jgi:hypothetical protein
MGLWFAPISAVALARHRRGFPTCRYTGTSLNLNTPLIASAVIGVTGNVASPALLVVAGGIISAATGLAMTETAPATAGSQCRAGREVGPCPGRPGRVAALPAGNQPKGH